MCGSCHLDRSLNIKWFLLFWFLTVPVKFILGHHFCHLCTFICFFYFLVPPMITLNISIQILGLHTSFFGNASDQIIANKPVTAIKFYDFLSCWVLCATWLTWSITACCSTLLRLVIEFSCIRQHHEFWGPIVKFSFSKNVF